MPDTNIRISVESRDTAKLAAVQRKTTMKRFVEAAIDDAAVSKPATEPKSKKGKA